MHLVFRTIVAGAVLTATAAAPGALWLAPDSDLIVTRGVLARAVRDLSAGRATQALPAFLGASSDPELGPYARLFAARTYLAISQPSEARREVSAIMSGQPSDALAEAALLVSADAAAAQHDSDAELAVLTDLSSRPNSMPAAVEFRLLQTAIEAHQKTAAFAPFRRLFFEFPATQESADAIEEMQRIGVDRPAVTREDLARHLARADKLFGAARYTDARAAFAAIRPLAAGDDRELVDLRLAECDLFLKKTLVASTALRAFAAKPSSRVPEAEYQLLATVKALGREAEYVAAARAFADKYDKTSPAWAERALNDLGTHYILADEDEKAAAVFSDMYARFPAGAFSDRAAWRSGWWAYKQGRFEQTAVTFESAAVAMRRADYRSAWLYWAARAHQQLGHRDAALDAFRRVIADYRNSYYGRAAMREAERLLAQTRPAGAGPVSPARLTWPATIAPSPRPANASLIVQLLAAGMYDEALAELRRLQTAGNGSPLVDATVAYAFNRQGKLRQAITSMRRAYPQFMAEGGEALPNEILTVIFPIDHWPLLQAQAAERQLDPYLVAALVAQESTFQADIKSSANAWGLMQVVPATGRRYAATLGIKPFSTFRLTEPEVNVRIGTAMFADLVKRFGDIAPALAAYNAGPERVSRWLAERSGFDRDEFIDDIPFPETQNYVKRILGTVEDYRILYGKGTR